ncbi:MAG TPA: exo-alpha-sialidase [Bryobacteraceae bacterium]|nr:exo-alpha-sialidase [Bryobacteraceae bacterium]
MRIVIAVLAALCAAAADKPLYEAELVFPLEHWHNHSSSLVELPDGDLLVCWYNGSGERTADDVKIEAARRVKGGKEWGSRFTLADTPGFPDTNPILFVDSHKRLWLVWPVILANRWETALLKYRIASVYPRGGAPKWEVSDPLLFIPRNFTEKTQAITGPLLKSLAPGRLADEVKQAHEQAADKYASRMGWMPRVHPLQLPSGRILVPLYSDGFNFSLIAITDDFGATWTTSEPIVSAGGVQPSLVRRRDGTLVAYMRDNGPAPKRVPVSESKDDGITWSAVTDTDIPNPGTSLEVIALRDGTWVMVGNDTEKGRHSLAVSLSDDEGKAWNWTRRLEFEPKGTSSFDYPSVIEARDGSIHVSYSYSLNYLPRNAPRRAIKHARFNSAWVKAAPEAQPARPAGHSPR